MQKNIKKFTHGNFAAGEVSSVILMKPLLLGEVAAERLTERAPSHPSYDGSSPKGRALDVCEVYGLLMLIFKTSATPARESSRINGLVYPPLAT